MVTEQEIKKLYGSNRVNFTLEMFENMGRNKQKLMRYRKEL